MISLLHGLGLSIILFILGLLGIVIRYNLFFILISLEIILHSSALAFVVVGSYLGHEDAQIMYMLIITVAAAESAIALSLLLQVYRFYGRKTGK